VKSIGPLKTCSIRWGRIGLGYIAAVFVGMMGTWASLEIADAITYGRPPLFSLYPGRILRITKLAIKMLPAAMLIAAPFTLLATACLIKLRLRRWWHFSLAGAASPLAGIMCAQLLTMGRFFHHDVTPLAFGLMPIGILAAWIYWLIGFYQQEAMSK
jgi:hypothetical protein